MSIRTATRSQGDESDSIPENQATLALGGSVGKEETIILSLSREYVQWLMCSTTWFFFTDQS
eukprot:scaffold1890_cov132-Skeletonema_marinoi.AAC.4